MTGNDLKRYIYTLELEDLTKKVDRIDFDLIVEDIEGTVHFTDLQLQEGRQITGHMPATQDLLDKVSFNINEFAFLETVSNSVKRGTQPILHENVTNRFYNIVGRGHEVLVIPNVFQENPLFSMVTSALDLELYAKEDFDLLRIRTNDGGLVEGRCYSGFPDLADHSLNYKYTREFYFPGGNAGDKIELKATIRAATLDNVDVPLRKHSLTLPSGTINIDRQRFMLAPAGSFRIGIEFYKQVTESMVNDNGETVDKTYLKDIGIGYYGLAVLNQWTYGRSKL